MFSLLPTNPRDWITVDALPSYLPHWRDSALYIIGDKSALSEVAKDSYRNIVFIPVEVREGDLERDIGRGRQAEGEI